MKTSSNTLIFILSSISYQVSGEVFLTKLHQQFDSLNTTSCTILTEELISKNRNLHRKNGELVEISTYPDVHTPEDTTSSETDCPQCQSFIIEIYSMDQSSASDYIDKICTTTTTLEPFEPLISARTAAASFKTHEVVKVIDGGDSLNRIDVVFMGDGYTLEEKGKFFDDINRLTKDTFDSVTFRNFLPLFNIWAIFVPSKESGIGYNNTPKNTPFKLYRSKGVFRGVYTKNPNYARQICKLTGPSGCDYPSLIGNDEYYGGLGGEFAISTRSHRTGVVVLRHEFGHNFAKVGEEYDSGVVYKGANSASSVWNIKWKSWLTNPNNGSVFQVKQERLIYRILEYPSSDLDKQPLTFSFKSDGTYSRWYLFLTVTGASEADSLEFILDGKPLPWKSSGFDDKEFYDWFGDQGLSKGQHKFTIMVKKMSPSGSRNVPRMVGSVSMYEYGNEEEYHSGSGYISAYPTWDFRKRKTYRPTNAGCLMRNMTHDQFCSVCKEEMWLQFFRRVSLIDSLVVEGALNSDGLTKNVTLRTLELGQFRRPGTEVEGERLEIKWFKNGQLSDGFSNSLKIVGEKGRWSLEVRFITPEVRNDPKGLLIDIKLFNI